MKPEHEEIIEYKGKKYLLKEYFDNDFSKLKKATQCYGLILNDQNEVLLVSEDNIKWTLPGGTPEEGETYEQTLIREIYEESAVQIDESYIHPFYYNVSYEIVDNKPIYNTTQLRFISKVKRLDKFIKDQVEMLNIEGLFHWKILIRS